MLLHFFKEGLINDKDLNELSQVVKYSNIELFSILEYIAVFLGIVCVYLQTKEIVWAWPAGIISVFLYVIIFHQSYLYSDMVLHFIYIILNALGWWNWRSSNKGKPVLKIGLLNRKQKFITVATIIFGTSLWGYLFMIYTDAQLVFFDAFTTVGSLVAQYLLVKKYIENWILWIIVDIVAVNVYIYKGLYPTAFLFGIFILLCSYGWYEWHQKVKFKHQELHDVNS